MQRNSGGLNRFDNRNLLFSQHFRADRYESNTVSSERRQIVNVLYIKEDERTLPQRPDTQLHYHVFWNQNYSDYTGSAPRARAAIFYFLICPDELSHWKSSAKTGSGFADLSG